MTTASRSINMTGADADLNLFTAEEIRRVANLSYTRRRRGRDRLYIECLVRKREVLLGREERVRQLWLHRLATDYGYPISRIQVERVIPMGRSMDTRADIVIMDADRPDAAYVIFEVKEPRERDGKEQLHSYTNATGAPLAAWSNGSKLTVWNRKDPNYFVPIPRLPSAAQTIDDVWKDEWHISTLESLERDRETSGVQTNSLQSLILDMEDEVLANAGVDVFEEVFKLIFIKLYDEIQSSRDSARPLRFRNSNTPAQLSRSIHDLYDAARNAFPGVFEDDRINLSPEHLQVCVGSMETWKLFNANLDVIDNAFEYLVGKSSKGEKGQFFTPRWVVDMCVKMLDPQEHETMIDTACGSSGFAIHTIFHVWRNIMQSLGRPESDVLTAVNKPEQCERYVRDNVFGIDFDEKCVRVSRCLNLIAGDGQSNILHLNTLDWARWGEHTIQPEWTDIYSVGWSRLRRVRNNPDEYDRFNFDVLFTNPPFAGRVAQGDVLSRYHVASQANGRIRREMARDALFIERNIDFLRPGGRMAMVLPLGRFNNNTSKPLRDYIMESCRVLAVVSLDNNTFQPHTGTKTGVLFVQKWNDDESEGPLCPKTDDYRIFFAEQRKSSTNGSGTRQYVSRDGELIRDSNRQYVVDHDLFNHEGLTRDGIAEAFQRFAASEKLSFAHEDTVDDKDFSPGYLVSSRDAERAGRWDPKYFRPEHTEILNRAVRYAGASVRLGDIATHNARGKQPQYVEDGEINVIVSGCIREGWLDYDEFQKTSREWYDANPTTHVQYGDILTYTTGKYIGRTAIYLSRQPAAASNHVNILRIKDEDPAYIAFIMNSEIGRAQTIRFSGGGGQGELYSKDIAEFVIPVMPDDQKTAIIKALTESDAARRRAVELMGRAEDMLDTLLSNPPVEEMTQ